MDKDIRYCFSLYLNHMKSQIKNLKGYNVDEMSITEIRNQLDIIHMQYIISSFAVSKSSTAVMSYNHLKEMIDNNISKLEYEIKLLKEENIDLINKLDEVTKLEGNIEFESVNIIENKDIGNNKMEEQKKGWFFG